MRLVKLISNLGYGSQREVKAMIQAGRVTSVAGEELGLDARAAHGDVRVDGEPLDPAAGLVLMLNKPCGYTCSTADPGRIVYELLPSRFARRKPIVAPVGRLDRDTSGLLLMTDDGQFLHKVISPKSSISKTYQVTLADPLRGDEGAVFASGTLMLRSEKDPLLPAKLEVTGEKAAAITITEGRYHQVRRMFAAVGNKVETLRRIAIGGLGLGDLEEGDWRLLTPEDIVKVTGLG
ncbi:MAG TPA: 16S rRNA pseudouridine(516) synthase [Magnetospirillum sp.]|jgi:16S rRNA pseudouridine516 synthase|nr:16S rRNA pseudouridine(516) synthase [Magnetospirillum sp.]